MKPGKPIFFGTRGATMIFGLPGNPVSSLVCFELFVRPAVRKILGHPDPEPRWLRARLVEDFPYRTDRPTYYPACLESGEDGWLVRPLPWGGSWNLRSVADANALVLFPTGEHQFQQGEGLPVLSLE
jgi:molybdopterin molybdotransferase